MRQITHTTDSISITVRERIGMDELDYSTIILALRDHVMASGAFKTHKDIPNRVWGRIGHVTNVIQQTLSVEGEKRIDVPAPHASDEDLGAFYDFYLSLPDESIVKAFSTVLELISKEPDPNPIGPSTEGDSTSSSNPDSTHPTTLETDSSPANAELSVS